jgi:hypothetical protein
VFDRDPLSVAQNAVDEVQAQVDLKSPPLNVMRLGLKEIRRSPLHSRLCFCSKPAKSVYVRKVGSPYNGQWVWSCYRDRALGGCGFFQPDNEPPFEQCLCEQLRPAKLCVSKKEHSKGWFFLTCGADKCKYFRWLPLVRTFDE